MTGCGIVENLLLVQCEDRLAGALCGHLETGRLQQKDAEKVRNGTVVIHHVVTVAAAVIEDTLLVSGPLFSTLTATLIGTPVQLLVNANILSNQTWQRLNAYRHVDTVKMIQLNMRMGKKGDSSFFKRGMIVGSPTSWSEYFRND